MANLITTLGKIKLFKPCEPGYKKLCKTLGSTAKKIKVSLLQILDSNGVEDAYWSLNCWDYRDYCLLIADVIEPALTISDCDAVKSMSQTIRSWHSEDLTDSDLAAASAAAMAAARDEASAAARDAAMAAASAAAWAAARDEASAAARDAASAAARDEASAAAWAAAWDAARSRNEELMREFIERDENDI